MRAHEAGELCCRCPALLALRQPTLAPHRSALAAETSTSAAGNLPLALLVVATIRWVFLQLEAAQRAQRATSEARSWRREAADAPAATPPSLGLPPGAARPDAWRKFVHSPVVEEAWSRFAGSIIQQVCSGRCHVGAGRRSPQHARLHARSPAQQHP